MNKLTLSDALSDCATLWGALADDPPLDVTPEEGRNRALGRLSAQLNHPSPMAGCPCCEYVRQQGEIPGPFCAFGSAEVPALRGCPLASLWPMGCAVEGSPYHAWREAIFDGDREKAVGAARSIADAARAKLAPLEGAQSETTKPPGLAPDRGRYLDEVRVRSRLSLDFHN